MLIESWKLHFKNSHINIKNPVDVQLHYNPKIWKIITRIAKEQKILQLAEWESEPHQPKMNSPDLFT